MNYNFQEFLFKNLKVSNSDYLILTVSGGKDSMVMLNLFQKLNMKFVVAHCNFQLRGAESERDMNFVKNYCQKNQIDLFTARFDTLIYAQQHKLSIQMAARKLRYDWFEKLKIQINAQFIATAHHLNDQAETFFINLLRGTGLFGLHGIPAQNNHIIRPLLFATAEMINDYAVTNHLDFVEDSSNLSDKYLRNSIRHHIIPAFVEQNPKFVLSLSKTIDQISAIEKIISKQTKLIFSNMIKLNGEKIIVNLDDLLKIDDLEIYLFEFLAGYGFNHSIFQDILLSLKTQKSGLKFCSETYSLIKERNSLILTPNSAESLNNNTANPFSLIFEDMSTDSSLPLDIKIIEKPDSLKTPKTIALIDHDSIKFPLIIRKWKTGDFFYPLGLNGKKLISDYFIDNKFDSSEKENTFLLCNENEIVWIIGHRIDERYKVKINSKNVLKIELTNGNYKKS
jgi:tRNA(Ile)-lysidine synthase